MVIASKSDLRLAPHLRRKLSYSAQRQVKNIMRDNRLATVCEEARCPNMSECFSHNTATFMIMGDRCTRRCHFCSVQTKKPLALDPNEPRAVARAASLMGLDYIVITSVDRDELPDLGAQHFVNVVSEVKNQLPHAEIELLTPDFKGRHELLDQVLRSAISVFGHNIESVSRLYKSLRPQSDFLTTCGVLRYAGLNSSKIIKSGLMVGVGERDEEVLETLDLLYDLGVHIVTIGQYLRPSLKHWPVDRYVNDESFLKFVSHGKKIGLRHVYAGALVRSSYHAREAHDYLCL
jgi:lipoic acid synthetase